MHKSTRGPEGSCQAGGAGRGEGRGGGMFGHEYILHVSLSLYTRGNTCHRTKLVLMYFKNSLFCFYNLDGLKCLRSERRGRPPVPNTQHHDSPKFQGPLFMTHVKKKSRTSRRLWDVHLFFFFNRTGQTWKYFCSKLAGISNSLKAIRYMNCDLGFTAVGSGLWELGFVSE